MSFVTAAQAETTFSGTVIVTFDWYLSECRDFYFLSQARKGSTSKSILHRIAHRKLRVSFWFVIQDSVCYTRLCLYKTQFVRQGSACYTKLSLLYKTQFVRQDSVCYTRLRWLYKTQFVRQDSVCYTRHSLLDKTQFVIQDTVC